MSDYNNENMQYDNGQYNNMQYGGYGVDPNEEAEKKKKKTMLILLLVLVMCVLGGVFLWLNGTFSSNEGGLERELAAEYGFLPGMTQEDIQAKLNEIIDKSMLNISINPTPIYENGSAAGNIRIENTPNNHYGFLVGVVLIETGQTILQTGVIEPGQFVENRALDVVLPAGEYECIAHFVAFDLETSAEIGQTSTAIVITVKN